MHRHARASTISNPIGLKRAQQTLYEEARRRPGSRGAEQADAVTGREQSWKTPDFSAVTPDG